MERKSFKLILIKTVVYKPVSFIIPDSWLSLENEPVRSLSGCVYVSVFVFVMDFWD